jgi:hypothetical protein
MNGHIYYCAGYKYQLVQDYHICLPIIGLSIITKFIELDKAGTLTIKENYAWDGCSGPTIDDSTNMRAGLVHDALYQLIRLGLLDGGCRDNADKIFYDILIEDGMLHLRAEFYYQGVSLFGNASAKLGTEPYPILVAP